MYHVETPPSWALRLKERSRLRRTGDRITRWIALPMQRTRIIPQPAVAPASGTGAVDLSSNDNLFAGPSRAFG